MKRPLRWTLQAIGSLAAVLIAAYAVVYVLSERIVQRTWPIPPVALTVPADPADIAEGQRLARIHGCYGGCHGKQAAGGVLFDQPIIGRVVAANLTAVVRKYSDAELAVAIRNGLRPDGRSLIVMPSEAFIHLSDAELGRIIAFLKSLPPAKGTDQQPMLGPLGRIGLLSGKFRMAAQLIADAEPLPAAANEEAARGRHLAQTICAHCHGTSLRGDSTPDFTSPDLAIVAAYAPEAFATLMRTGTALGGRQLGLMSAWAKNNLSQLTDAEIAGLYAYLHALPEARRN